MQAQAHLLKSGRSRTIVGNVEEAPKAGSTQSMKRTAAAGQHEQSQHLSPYLSVVRPHANQMDNQAPDRLCAGNRRGFTSNVYEVARRKVIANPPVQTATQAGQGQTRSGAATGAPCAVRVLTMISPPHDKGGESNVGSNAGSQVLSASVVLSCPELQTQQSG